MHLDHPNAPSLRWPMWIVVLGWMAAAALVVPQTASAELQVELDWESGAAFPDSNAVRIPNSGTAISFTDDFSIRLDPLAYFRGRVSVLVDRAHWISVLAAPFQYDIEGRVSQAVSFAGQNFAANSFLRGSYRFNSFRLSYRYQGFDWHPDWLVGFGITAKIRDAAISLEDGTQRGEKTDVGLVPLLNVLVEWRIIPTAGLRLEADALVGPNGRAEDVSLAVWWQVAPAVRVRAGYRLLEGGADNDTVYNFALVHFVFVGGTLTL